MWVPKIIELIRRYQSFAGIFIAFRAAMELKGQHTSSEVTEYIPHAAAQVSHHQADQRVAIGSVLLLSINEEPDSPR